MKNLLILSLMLFVSPLVGAVDNLPAVKVNGNLTLQDDSILDTRLSNIETSTGGFSTQFETIAVDTTAIAENTNNKLSKTGDTFDDIETSTSNLANYFRIDPYQITLRNKDVSSTSVKINVDGVASVGGFRATNNGSSWLARAFLTGSSNYGVLTLKNSSGDEKISLSANASAVANYIDADLGVGTKSPSSRLHISSGTVLVDGDIQTAFKATGNKIIAHGEWTSIELQAATPAYPGATVYNSDLNVLCYSTGTAIGQWSEINGGPNQDCF